MENSRSLAEYLVGCLRNSKQNEKKDDSTLSAKGSHVKYSCHLFASRSCSLVCCNSFSKDRLARRSPRKGTNVENSPIASSSSANFRPSCATPTTMLEDPAKRESAICHQASPNENDETLQS